MSLDCSRFSFNAWNDFLGVVMQQGRVQLDADWNELVAQLIRRIQTGTLDTFEHTVVPRVTPDGFRIQANAGALSIGVGRIYVDGILAENHGRGALQWEPRLAEQVGSAAIAYDAQPYYPSPPQLPAGGSHLVYLDVWQRQVTWLQNPGLVEKAVGVDTTARLQTVWQVKLLPNIGAAQCGTPDDAVRGWADAIRPSAARLTTATGQVAEMPNPCQIPPSGGYKGLENQLYRVEIHDGGVVGAATFKWSRDNGSVQSLVRQINAARDRVVVDSIGRDALLRFSDGDWIEITDDVRELNGQPGIMRRIRPAGGVDDATRTIMLDRALPAGVFLTNPQDETQAERHTRIRRWDQSGRVLRADGTLFHDLNAAGGTGAIPVPPAGVDLFLENGILARLELAAGGDGFHVADHWSFAARAADASIEILDHAPPLGTHHHYARLAVVTFPNGATDCRIFWPPESAAGNDCSCDICVTVQGHKEGTATIQHAIDRLRATGGVICLGAGTYRLREPLRIAGAHGLRIRGKNRHTVLIVEGTSSAIRIDDSTEVVLEEFAVAGAARDSAEGGAVRGLVAARNTAGLLLDRLYLLALPLGDGVSVAAEFGGYTLGAKVRDCAIVADIGIASAQLREGYLLTGNVAIADNLLVCKQNGILFGGRTMHYGDTVVARNLFLQMRRAGLTALGGGMPGSAFRIDANSLYCAGDGIVAGVDGLHITDNEIHGMMDAEGGRAEEHSGIVLERGLDPSSIAHAWITGNRIADLSGSAIEVRAPLGAAIIKHNILERARGGIVFVDAGACEGHLSIDNNQLLGIATNLDPDNVSIAAIQILAARNVDIVGNRVSDFALVARRDNDCTAIRVVAGGDVRITVNRLDELGPRQRHTGHVAGIELLEPYWRATINENMLSRSAKVDLQSTEWQAIRISPPMRKNFSPLSNAIVIYADETYLLTRKRLRALARVQPQSLAIRGNHGTARAIASQLVIAAGAASCIFSDNHFEASRTERVGAAVSLVDLSAVTVIASSNRLRWVDDDLGALNISGAKNFTVLGNVTMGDIRIDNNPLPAPWAPLNVLAF